MNSTNNKSNSLMGDLESIKALLEEDDLELSPETLSQALHPYPRDPLDPLEENELEIDQEALEETPTEIPVLADPLNTFDPKTGVSTPIAQTSDQQSLVSHASLDALLGDDFHTATAEVMQRARGLINQHANEWSPQQTDELADALRVRIDGAVQEWIQTSLAAHAGELQQRLLTAVRHELARHLEAFESTSD